MALTFFSGFALVINAIRKAPVLVIGRIHSHAVGGGVGLACAVDIAYAHESASARLSELAIGIGPFVVGPAVERKVGTGQFGLLSATPAKRRQRCMVRDQWHVRRSVPDRGSLGRVHRRARQGTCQPTAPRPWPN